MLLGKIDSKSVELIPLGDYHVGNPFFMEEKFKKTIEYVKSHKNCYVLLMGDMIENITTYSVGEIYEQKMNPDEQIEYNINALYPIRDKILGVLKGNHEARTEYRTSINPAKLIAVGLRVRYLGRSTKSVAELRIGDIKYDIYATHGGSSATTVSGKLNSLLNLTRVADADVYLMGHSHDIITHVCPIMTKKGLKLRYFFMTGSYVDYGGYAQDKNLPIGLTGSPVLIFNGEKKEVRSKLLL